MPAHLGDGTCLEATTLALHCHIWPNGRSGSANYLHWIPRSVIADESDVTDQGDVGEIFVRTWYAERNDLPHDSATTMERYEPIDGERD